MAHNEQHTGFRSLPFLAAIKQEILFIVRYWNVQIKIFFNCPPIIPSWDDWRKVRSILLSHGIYVCLKNR